MIASYEIGLAQPSDAERIAALSRRTVEYGLDWTWTPRRVLRSLTDAATNTIVARGAGPLLGFAIMKYRDTEAHLLLLAVEAAQRRRGVASALLEWLEITVRTAGIESIRAEVRASNRAARAFYRRRGFAVRRTLPGYYQGVDDALVLVKPIAAV